MKIQDRLRKIIEHYNSGNQSEFGRVLNVEQNVVANWLYRGFGKGIAEKITEVYTDVSVAWLLTGEGSMLKSDKIKSNVTPVKEGNYMMVEYADLRASAGKLGVGDVELLPDTHKRLVPKEFDNGNFLIVRVDGDSMDNNSRNSLCDGDEVLICERQDYKINELPIRNSLFVITTQDGNVLKQIAEVNMDEEYIVCRSFNPSAMYSDFKIYFRDIFQIFIVCKVTNRQIRF